ncbi:MAG: DNA-binding protein WhiA [Eubacteriales bacterium]|nr:DNA-binding protein WhiA [Eubacteriales bacterium]
MSFSGTVKTELARQVSDKNHCLKAEAAALVSSLGKIKKTEDGNRYLSIQSENEAVIRKCFTIIEKKFNIETAIQSRNPSEQGVKNIYVLEYKNEADIKYLLENLGFDNLENNENVLHVGCRDIIKKTCCKRAFLRGVFLASGSMSDPAKSYHFEIVCREEKKAQLIQKLMNDFEIEAKIVMRKKSYVVYVKEGSQIVDMLAIMGANVSLMEFENIRIVKEMRNTVNRKVNCETANINKTVNAAVKQREDILLIQQRIGFQNLAKGLSEMAELRLQYPEATLKELGMMLEPQVGKSGVNHRLRKLSEIAEDLRKSKEELI